LQDGRYLTVSEANVTVEFLSAEAAPKEPRTK
jgi:hypothetical protein